MSYKNFVATIWSKQIQTSIEESTSLWDGCNHKFEGEAKHGGKVKILGVNRPTIGDYTGADIGAPEDGLDSAAILDIDQAKFFNFAVDDIDKAQGKEGLMPALIKEAASGLAAEREECIATLFKTEGKKSSATTVSSASDAKALVDGAFTYIWEQGVKVGDNLELDVAPWFYQLFKDYLVSTATDNMEMLKKGIVGVYNGAVVRVSNKIQKDNSDYYYMALRTPGAVAAAGQITETEAYRPDGLFSDAVKGLDVYGARVVRPKELYILKAKA